MSQPLTRDFRETVREQLQDKEFRRAFLSEIIHDLLTGDLDFAKLMLREYINGTVGFIAAGEALGRSPKSLMRMLSATGNPLARNLFDLLAYLQKADGVVFEVKAVKVPAARRAVKAKAA
jgi:DNA-binding phage protein